MLKTLVTVVRTFPPPTLECTHDLPSAMERQSSEGSVISTDDSLFSKLSGASEAGSPITNPWESTEVLTRTDNPKGDSIEDLPAFLFNQSSDHACELKHLHHDYALRLTNQRSRLSSFRRPRFSTLYTRFAEFPRQSEPLLEQATRRVEWSQPNANTASSSTGFVSPFLLSLPFAPSQTIFVGTTVIQYA